MPFIIGGTAAASGIMSAISGSGQAKAQAMAAQLQQQDANFRNRWQVEADNRNILRQWEAQQIRNQQIAASANTTLTRGTIFTKEAFANQSSAMSKNTRATTAQFLGAASARGLSPDSASSRAMLRAAAEQEKQNSLILRTNWENQKIDLKTSYDNMLAQRNLNAPQQTVFMESRSPVVDNSSAMLMTGLATSLLGSVSAGMGAYRQMGA